METELLAQLGQQPAGDRIQRRPGHGQHRLADALQRAAAVAEVGEFAEGLPQEALFHPARQPAVMGQVLVFQQFHAPVMLPSHVRRQEFGYQGFRVHVQDRGGIVELVRQLVLEVGPVHAGHTELVHGMGQRSPNVVLVGPGAEEPGPMRGILDGVGKGDELLVVVVGTGPTALHHLGAKGGIAGAHQEQFVPLAAGRAGVVVPRVLGLADHLGALGGHPKRARQLLVTTSQAGPITLLHIAAGHAH